MFFEVSFSSWTQLFLLKAFLVLYILTWHNCSLTSLYTAQTMSCSSIKKVVCCKSSYRILNISDVGILTRGYSTYITSGTNCLPLLLKLLFLLYFYEVTFITVIYGFVWNVISVLNNSNTYYCKLLFRRKLLNSNDCNHFYGAWKSRWINLHMSVFPASCTHSQQCQVTLCCLFFYVTEYSGL